MNIEDVTTLYSGGYQIQSICPEALKAWEGITDALIELFWDCTSFVDVGCGGGGLVAELQRRGRTAYGIEGSKDVIGLLPVPIIIWDLRQPLKIGCKSDVVTCFDVAEHVGAAEVLVDTICDLSNEWVVFGAAPPGQDGLGHIDLRPPEEWQEFFKKKGFHKQEATSDRVREIIRQKEGTNFLWWVEKNLQVFRRHWAL